MKRLTPKERDRATVAALKMLDHSCMTCEYDEAEGALINHCNACCRHIVRQLWLRREDAARRLK